MTLDEISDKLDTIAHRLFEDNGGECLQSKLNRHEEWMRNHNSSGASSSSKWSTYFPIVIGIILVAADFIFRYVTGK